MRQRGEDVEWENRREERKENREGETRETHRVLKPANGSAVIEDVCVCACLCVCVSVCVCV